MKPIADIMGQLHDKMDGMSKIKKVDLMKTIFGTTGIAAASALSDSSKHLHSFTDEVKKANKIKYAQNLSKKNMDNPVNQLKRLKASFDQLGMSVSSTVAGPLTGGINKLNGILTKLNHSSPETKKLVAGLAIGIPVVSGALTVLGSGIRNVRTIASVTGKFHNDLDKDTREEIGLLRSKNRKLEEQIELVQELTREYGSMNRTESEGGSGSNFSNTGSSGGNNGISELPEKEGKRTKGKISSPLKETETVGKDVENSSKSVGKLGKLGKFGGKLVKSSGKYFLLADAAFTANDLIHMNKSNAGETIGGDAGGSLGSIGGGMAAGAAYGAAAGSETGPGAIVTGAIGAGVGGIAGSKYGKQVGKYAQNQYNNVSDNMSDEDKGIVKSMFQSRLPKGSEKYLKPSDFKTTFAGPKIDTTNPFEKHSKGHVFVGKQKTLQDKEIKDNNFNEQIDNLSKSDGAYVKVVRKQVIDAIGSAGDKSNNLFKKLYETASSYADKQKAKQKKNYDYLVKNGLISTQNASSDLNTYSQKQKQTLDSIKQKINEVNINEHLSASERAKKVASLNADLVALTDKGSNQQKKIKDALNGETQKMSLENYLKIRNDSEKAYQSTKNSAEKTKDTQIKAAAQKYDQEIKTANNTKGLSKSQRKYITNQAQKQYDDSTDAAQKQYDDVVQAAKNQHKDVVKEAQDQAGDMKDAFDGAYSGMTYDLNTIAGYSNSLSRIFNEPSTETWKQPKDFGQKLSNQLKNPMSNGLNYVPKTPFQQKEEEKKHPKSKKRKKTKGIDGSYGYFTGYANGSNGITKDQMALLGEQGTEAIYNPKTNKIRLVNNGPALSHLKAGEHVLNAKDTQKLLHGGLGKNLTLKGYAKGTDSLNNKKEYSIKLKNNKSLDKFKEHSKKIWNGINNDTKTQVSRLHKNTTQKTKDTKKDVLDHFSAIQKGSVKNTKDMADSINTIFGRVPKYAHNSMATSIGSLNKGFSGINETLNQFGSHENVLSPIHYATGSNGRVTKEHMAIVNDAKNGPEQEAIVKENGIFLPKNKDHLTKLNSGDSVLNGSQTRHYLDAIGLSHYAKGTGVSDNDLKKLINNSIKHPKSSLDSNFKNHKSTFDSPLSNGLRNSSKSAISPEMENWYKQIWQTLKDATGSSSEFLNYAKKNFTGDKYKLGANGPDLYDCSSMVEAALSHFGIQLGRTTTAMQSSNQLTKLGKDIDKSRAGDLVLFGHGDGANGHVGIVDNPSNGTMFNETPPYAATTKISDVTSVPLDGYYRINGLHSDNKENPLSKLTKKQLGKQRLNWVAKHLGTKMSYNGPVPVGDHADLLKQAGIPENEWSAFNYIISNESSWNPHARNSSGAYGLPQSLPARKMSSAGSDWVDNPVTQLKWMKKYVKSAYGGIFNAQKHWQNHHNYENGGLIASEQMAHVGEKNKPEMVLPLTNKSRTVQLAQQALKYVHAMNGNDSNTDNVKIEQLEKVVDKMAKDNRKMVQILTVIADKVSKPTRAVVADKDIVDAYTKHKDRTQMSAAIRRGENILG